MADENFRLYPRGFLGGQILPQVVRIPKPYGEQLSQHQYSVNTHQDNGRSIEANPNVESLYAEYIKNCTKVDSPEFRAQVLKATITAFGTKNFAIWYAIQFKSLAAGRLHKQFLEDTLKFILDGRREMSLETWQSLVLITDEGDKIGTHGNSDVVKSFFAIYDNQDVQSAKTRFNLIDVIQDWCSKPGGIEDMLGTLHILFGNP